MSQRGAYGGRADNTAVVSNVLNLIASKEGTYKQHIKANHVLAKNAARRIRGFEETLAKTVESLMTAEEWQTYLTQQKENLKSITKTNVMNEREVDSFCEAVRAVQTQLQQQQHQQPVDASDTMQDDGLANDDFVQKIQDAIATVEADKNAMQLDVEQEVYYREIAQLLGEQLAAVPKTNRRGIADNDDDIEVSESLGGAELANLKCPISGLYMEDAVRNKVCAHVYSLAGIVSHIKSQRAHSCNCPITGCGNRQVTETQLEEDVETKMNVRRAIRQESQRLEQQKSQANDLMDSDED